MGKELPSRFISPGRIAGFDLLLPPWRISFHFLRFLPRTFDPRWLRRLSSALLEQQPAAHDDAAEFARRRSRVIFFCGRPLRDHPLNNILLQLLHICSAAAGDVRQRTNVHGAADLLLLLRHVQQGRPGREARPTAHIHRPHRRFRLAPAHSRAGCRFPRAGASRGQHAAIRPRAAAGGPAAGQG